MKAHLPTVAVTATILAVAVSGVAMAGTADDPIQACVNNGSGAIRIADDCRDSETSLTWNRTGPQGPAGETGATGPEGPPGPGAAEPATYLGSHALFLDGRYLGPLHSVEGCGLRTEVVETRRSAPDGQTELTSVPGAANTDDCWVEVGLGLDAQFYGWLATTIESGPDRLRADVVVAKVEVGGPVASYHLTQAWPHKVEVSPVVGGSGRPVFLRVGLAFDSAEQRDPTGLTVGSMEEHPIDPDTLMVAAEGAPVAVDLVQGLSTSFDLVETRTVDQSGRTVIVKVPGNRRGGAVTVGAPGPVGGDYLRAWYAALDDQRTAFRALQLTMADTSGGHTLTVQIPRAWSSAIEPFPRLDGRTRATLELDAWTLGVD